MCNKPTTQPITNKENTKKKKDYRRKIEYKFSAKADSIYVKKLTKPFLNQALFWSHLIPLTVKKNNRKMQKLKKKKSYETNNHNHQRKRERFNSVVVHMLEASKIQNNKIRDNMNNKVKKKKKRTTYSVNSVEKRTFRKQVIK